MLKDHSSNDSVLPAVPRSERCTEEVERRPTFAAACNLIDHCNHDKNLLAVSDQKAIWRRRGKLAESQRPNRE